MTVLNEQEIKDQKLTIFIKKDVEKDGKVRQVLRHVKFPHVVNIETGDLSYWIPKIPVVELSTEVKPLDLTTPQEADIEMELHTTRGELVVAYPDGTTTATEKFNSENSF